MPERPKPSPTVYSAVTPRPPAKVTQAAHRYQLGPLINARKGSNPLLTGGTGLLAGMALIALSVLLAFLGQRVVALSVCALSFTALLLAAAALLGGQHSGYVYQDGLVHVSRGKVEVLTWPEVSELLLWRAGGKGVLAGQLLSYYLVTTDGRKLRIEARFANNRDLLGDQLQAAVTRLGRPVTESGPASGRLRP
jgi:hypothetical protein